MLYGCSIIYFKFFVSFSLLKPFEVNDLRQGLNFSKVLNSLVALNKATEGMIIVRVCVFMCVSNPTARINVRWHYICFFNLQPHIS